MDDKTPAEPSLLELASTTEGLTIDPSLEAEIQQNNIPSESALVNGRVAAVSLLAIVIAFAATGAAYVLVKLISIVTNIAFYGRLSAGDASPWNHVLGLFVIFVPVIGGILVGLMARYGSAAIRGHGIPEAMEQVLTNQSRIPPRITFLKPVSSAIAIGTGGPFGAEGPIIATGGALGSLVGQLLHTTAVERKTLLAAGAAAGMTAIFGSPVSAVLLAIELLLFELRPRSVIPVALACATAAGARTLFMPHGAIFAMSGLASPSGEALTCYILIGALVGVVSVLVTKIVYWVEDTFEKLPIHWMWWPAIGGMAVGLVGYFAPRTLGVGYQNIQEILNGNLVGYALLALCLLKFISWSVALGSGTSGGTLAPLFTFGGGFGALAGGVLASAAPQFGVDPRIAALVGMAAIFAGASRALLASIVFAFETTLQPMGLLPLLGGCTAAYFVSCLLMKQTIMTEKIARRGIRVPSEYEADFLAQIPVTQVGLKPVVTLQESQTVEEVLGWIASRGEGSQHQGFPILDGRSRIVGVLTRRDFLEANSTPEVALKDLLSKRPAVIFADLSLRDAADHMVREGVGRLPVVDRKEPWKVIGIVTRGDLLSAHEPRLEEADRMQKTIRVRRSLRRIASFAKGRKAPQSEP